MSQNRNLITKSASFFSKEEFDRYSRVTNQLALIVEKANAFSRALDVLLDGKHTPIGQIQLLRESNERAKDRLNRLKEQLSLHQAYSRNLERSYNVQAGKLPKSTKRII